MKRVAGITTNVRGDALKHRHRWWDITAVDELGVAFILAGGQFTRVELERTDMFGRVHTQRVDLPGHDWYLTTAELRPRGRPDADE